MGGYYVNVFVTHLQKVLTDFESVSVDRNKRTNLSNYCSLPRAQPGVSSTQTVQYKASNHRDSTVPKVDGECGRLPPAKEFTWPLLKSPIECGRLPRPKSECDATQDPHSVQTTTGMRLLEFIEYLK